MQLQVKGSGRAGCTCQYLSSPVCNVMCSRHLALTFAVRRMAVCDGNNLGLTAGRLQLAHQNAMVSVGLAESRGGPRLSI
ncbi:hypothetical protein VTK56DRAFT_6519 [Thermocarpiscus australiensis]